MASTEILIDIPAEHEKNVCGQMDSNLSRIERTLHVTMIERDGCLKIIGNEEDAEKAASVFQNLVELSKRGNQITEQNVAYALSLSFDEGEHRILEIDRDLICRTAAGRPVKPKTLGQKQYVDAVRKNDIVFGIGPAGTGKSYLAVAMAINALKNKEVEKIILARPAVEAGERLGFLPGDLQEKVDPYLRPLYDALYDILGRDAALRLKEKETIEVVPLAYMRGRTLDNSFIILDEAQNATKEQMKMFLTRMGFGSKVIVTGDVTQIDLPRGKRSGLVDAMHILNHVEGIAFCRLTDSDVVRHPLVRRIVNAYDRYLQKHPEWAQDE